VPDASDDVSGAGGEPEDREVCVIAHSFGYALVHGAAALNAVPVLGHGCDNPLCQRIGPGHVKASSHAENRRAYLARRSLAGSPLADARGATARAIYDYHRKRIELREEARWSSAVALNEIVQRSTGVPALEGDDPRLADVVSRLLDVEAIRNLGCLYPRAVDDGELDTLVGLFTADGALVRLGVETRGIDALRQMWSASRARYS